MRRGNIARQRRSTINGRGGATKASLPHDGGLTTPQASKRTTIMIDATYLKAHCTASSLGEKAGPGRLIGRIKGGMNTKRHAVTDLTPIFHPAATRGRGVLSRIAQAKQRAGLTPPVAFRVRRRTPPGWRSRARSAAARCCNRRPIGRGSCAPDRS